MFSKASVAITGGMINNATNMSIVRSKRGLDLLMDYIAVDALHNSDELYTRKFHPHTRVAVLDDIMRWIIGSEAQDKFMMWLFGAAGGGKSAIAKRIAELAEERGLLIGSFFFSRIISSRNTKDRLITTLAYQMALSIPESRNDIEHAIDTDPAIFHRGIQTQIDALLMIPFQSASMQTTCPNLFIIDGLDECSDSNTQVAILDAISRACIKHKLPIKCLVISRPETVLLTSFNSKQPLNSIHCRLSLDDTYNPYDDIRLFLSDKFEEIRYTHPLRSTIPMPWPTKEALNALVWKSSGQFIFAATVVRFVEVHRHRPAARLDIILGMLPPGTTKPFAELDALYRQILFSVDDIELTLNVLSLYLLSPSLADYLGRISFSEPFLFLEEGDIDRALIDLSSLISYDERSGRSGKVEILHASFVDFLFDTSRSEEFYIDAARARTSFVYRTLQFVKGPKGMRAGDLDLFQIGSSEAGWNVNGKLRSAILDFDLDAFIWMAMRNPTSERNDGISWIFAYWMVFIGEAATRGLSNKDGQLLIHRCRKSFKLRMQNYQSRQKLRHLPAFALVFSLRRNSEIPVCRCLDILLEIDDYDLHLIDQNALDLRYSSGLFKLHTTTFLRDITSRYVGGDKYASAALHCMRFLSNPPKYFDLWSDVTLTYAEWKETCHMGLMLLFKLLNLADTPSELIQIMSDHDIDTTVRVNLPDFDIWQVDAQILAFLSRGGVCVNWRIVSAIRRALPAIEKKSVSASQKLDPMRRILPPVRRAISATEKSVSASPKLEPMRQLLPPVRRAISATENSVSASPKLEPMQQPLPPVRRAISATGKKSVSASQKLDPMQQPLPQVRRAISATENSVSASPKLEPMRQPLPPVRRAISASGQSESSEETVVRRATSTDASSQSDSESEETAPRAVSATDASSQSESESESEETDSDSSIYLTAQENYSDMEESNDF